VVCYSTAELLLHLEQMFQSYNSLRRNLLCYSGVTVALEMLSLSYSSLCRVVFMPTTAELLLHSERVSRHVSGVEQALSELNEGLEVLSDNQTERVERLVDDVSRLDRIYTAATKLSRYISYVFIF